MDGKPTLTPGEKEHTCVAKPETSQPIPVFVLKTEMKKMVEDLVDQDSSRRKGAREIAIEVREAIKAKYPGEKK